MAEFFAAHALLPTGWAADVRIACDAAGRITEVTAGATPGPARRLRGHVIPGIANLHSHAFQRAMAGGAERRSPAGRDSFWTWRETMYRFALSITPEDAEAIAAQLYAECLERGFTQIAEFQYLHHAPDGSPYADRSEMAQRLFAAAAKTGLGITMLPSLYRHGGIFGAPPHDGQRRFLNDLDGFHAILERVRATAAAQPHAAWGVAPHSLRAVTPAMLAAMAELDCPIHIHAAEQEKEVEECLAATGLRPVEWLLRHTPLDRRWVLIHATHMTAEETRALAATGAVAGLCPSTEASLGDGIFPLPDYLATEGRLGFGTDSHVGICPAAELRQLETSQRLALELRSVATDEARPHPARGLLERALAGGAQACGVAMGGIAPGLRCDLVELDDEHPTLVGRHGDGLLDAWCFGPADRMVRSVAVGGAVVVEGGRHIREGAIRADFTRTMKRLGA
ncbi:formimidoylglutamate deiminase [Sediminicoccus sp. BL-A-41-H5]|uniref:formimidoylglutamate deiminase n=1 Tax=Sediminicoccus sp. BL-A-41-H5 TaxID=3421106 RepID=UPI003D67165C